MRKLISFEQKDVLARRIAELLKGLSCQQAGEVLIIVERLLKENAVFGGVSAKS